VEGPEFKLLPPRQKYRKKESTKERKERRERKKLIARQVIYLISHSPFLFALVIFSIVSCYTDLDQGAPVWLPG
jgi:hypothetical protein